MFLVFFFGEVFFYDALVKEVDNFCFKGILGGAIMPIDGGEIWQFCSL